MTKLCGRCIETRPAKAFSSHSNTADGLQPICNSCKSEYQKELRESRADETAMRNGVGYLERHQEKRKQEALNCLSDPRTVVQEVCGFDKPNSASAWAGMVNQYLRAGKPRPRYSRA